MAMPGKKFADVVVARFTKRPAAAIGGGPDGDEKPVDDGASAGATGADDDDESLEQGKVALAAVSKKDPAAFREAIKAIVHECMEEYGAGKK